MLLSASLCHTKLMAQRTSGPLEECGKSLQRVLESLENQRVGNKAQKIFKRITWPLKEGDTKDLFIRLRGIKRHSPLRFLQMECKYSP